MQSWWTVPEQEQALEAARSLFADRAGQSRRVQLTEQEDLVRHRARSYFTDDAFSSWPQYYSSNAAGEGFDIGGCAIPAFDGGEPGRMWLSFPSYGFAAVAKSAADRVPTLLRIADYLAAPFGTGSI